MAKATKVFRCQECGAETRKWAGRCESCGAWNSIQEEGGLSEAGPPARSLGAAKGTATPLVDLAGEEAPPPRMQTGVEELDRVLGGGLVNASAVLVGGDPGVGKSTLLLQGAARLAAHAKVIYVSGEEATSQVRMRAARLGLSSAPVKLAAATNLRDILTMLEQERPALVVIDSIQTMWSDMVDSAPGSVAQVRACAHELTSFAKRRGVAAILVGHVTKDGQIAGPRVIEHMVDAVLYFEGDRGRQYRILRAVKNRFGAADEIGVFEMTGAGLAEVRNPSALFLGERDPETSGSIVFAGVAGGRPMLVEIQALVGQSPLGTPRRAVVGLDSSRLAMVLAVLEARCGVAFAGLDVYLNAAGGLRVSDPSADLAMAAALLSARFDKPAPPDAVAFGEAALSGSVRPAAQAEARLKEAAKLGFGRAWTSPPRAHSDMAEEEGAAPEPSEAASGLQLEAINTLAALVARFQDD
ncbi:MAG: DNA repair protein RadA [Neomegalonema sp.]|nr:DNA repair protein RadA [Neomegalonema sp.]